MVEAAGKGEQVDEETCWEGRSLVELNCCPLDLANA